MYAGNGSQKMEVQYNMVLHGVECGIYTLVAG